MDSDGRDRDKDGDPRDLFEGLDSCSGGLASPQARSSGRVSQDSLQEEFILLQVNTAFLLKPSRNWIRPHEEGWPPYLKPTDCRS